MKRLLLLVSLFAAAFAANPFGPKSSGIYLPASDAADYRVGFWDIARFDPLFEQPRLPENMVLSAYPGDGTGWYLVQFSGPVSNWQLEQLSLTGAQFLGFHSRYTAFVKANSTVLARVAGLGFIRWAGVYQPGYKLWSGTLQDQGFGRVSATLFYPEDLAAAARELRDMGFEVVRTGTSEYLKVIEVDCGREDLAAIARLSWVMNIEEWHPAKPENVDCQWVAQTWAQNQRRVWDQGLFGEGEILGYSDGQIDPNHYAFRDQAVPITDTGEFPTHRKIAVLKKYPPARLGSGDSHGTHVGGTIAGNDSANGGTNLNDGHSKSARLVQLSPIPQPPGNDFTAPLNSITNNLRNPELRPRTISNSWWTGTMGQYTNAASTFDLFSWKNKDIQTVKSCGNQGQSSQYRVTEPGNSKSIISVASLQNGTSSTLLSTYSSRGPAPDGRIKPDISIPGENIMSARSGTTNDYVSMSGTSMAAPATNGSIGLLRNYLRKGYYPSGVANAADTWGYVSAAVLKAMVLVSADPNIGSYVIPSPYVGWGRFNLDSVMYFSTPSPDARKLLLYDDTTGLATGEYDEYVFQVTDSSLHLRIGVVWTDTNAAAGANPALINNLDCRLVAPNADFYKGSIYSNGRSVRNPTEPFDNLNPQEMLRVAGPVPGTWTLRVSAQNVVTTRQPYAVVITGAVGLGTIHDVGVTRIAAPTGVVDSGTVVTPACTVRNYGTVSEDYSVRLRIGTGYDTTVSVTGHAAGTLRRVEFPGWPANQPGSFAVSCSTELADDANPANDRRLDSCFVRRTIRDIGVVEIIAPQDTVDSGVALVPLVLVQNYGTRAEDAPFWIHIGAGYAESVHVALEPGEQDTARFPAWTPQRVGAVWMTCVAALGPDMNRSNDTLRDTCFVLPPTGVTELAGLPAVAALDDAVPTPFRRATVIRFALPQPATAKVAIYGAAGQLVRSLVEGTQPAGYHRVTWDGRDDAGASVARGIYYCRFRSGDFRAMKKLIKLD